MDIGVSKHIMVDSAGSLYEILIRDRINTGKPKSIRYNPDWAIARNIVKSGID